MPGGLIAALRAVVGAAGVLTDVAETAPFLTDWRDRSTGSAAAVVLPETTAQVAEVVRLAAAAGRPVYPQGGNTGLCCGAVPSGADDGIVLGLHRMSRIRRLDRADDAIVVDAGVVLSAVHEVAARIDRIFPLHLGSEGTAQIGGLVSTNAGGTNALRYGTARDLVYGLEVVLADGSVLDDLAPLRKRTTGYDLKHLFMGAEGTLGIVTGASLRLYPAIRAEAHAWAAVATVDAAVATLAALRDRFDTAVLACELLSREQVALVLRHIPGTRAPFPRLPEWSVLIELGSADPGLDLAAPLEDHLGGRIEAGAVDDAVVARSLAQSSGFWRLRHSVSEANKRAGHGLTHDVCLRVSSLPRFMDDCAALLRERFPAARPVVTCHLGDGNVHYIVMFPDAAWRALADPDAVEDAVRTAVHDVVAAHGGAFSAEHGIGRKLVRELAQRSDPGRYASFLSLKRAFDPGFVLNPGVVLDAPAPRERPGQRREPA